VKPVYAPAVAHVSAFYCNLCYQLRQNHWANHINIATYHYPV